MRKTDVIRRPALGPSLVVAASLAGLAGETGDDTVVTRIEIEAFQRFAVMDRLTDHAAMLPRKPLTKPQPDAR
ncbi:MAG: hypothetical protein ACRD2I_05030 [Vicinamibacterales bacterium]